MKLVAVHFLDKISNGHEVSSLYQDTKHQLSFTISPYVPVHHSYMQKSDASRLFFKNYAVVSVKLPFIPALAPLGMHSTYIGQLVQAATPYIAHAGVYRGCGLCLILSIPCTSVDIILSTCMVIRSHDTILTRPQV